MPLFTPSTFYYLSAATMALTIPKHIATGFSVIYPALAQIPSTSRENEIAKGVAGPTWDYAVVATVVLAALNAKWARLGGPRTLEEKLILWSSVLGSAVLGWQYWKVGMAVALPVLWGAPALSVVATLWSGC
ncbi:uncharacterized protein K452DRAFT_239283 [Aplosporella prunicola CBS 121167]|uniref:Uncharacterized protein n=1 Tax=Aplosporella prunicola CBS 121167 TaxID=1176127 RepID=A0A6A6AY75_9PEZI|nr:uncharacterized protein K452DRAFT_239283 [Aplosporella prunicola CBS 121167]KAF2135491.1 hypothetical protein K452DRAFT_239283 [Aplosporella prunicola CBS 121167]